MSTGTRPPLSRRLPNRPGRPSLTGASAALLGALLLGACVAQERYDEAVDTAQLYQRQSHDQEQYLVELQAENDLLKAKLEQAGVAVSEANARVDQRVAELEKMMAQLGPDSESVTVLDLGVGYGFRVGEEVLFDSGSAQISAEGEKVLAKLGQAISAAPYGRVWVRGHTDTDPIARPETRARYPRGNLELSTDRALAVADFLVKRGGVDAKLLAVAGFGPNQPVAPNDSAENKRRNRRVEVFVLDEEGGPEAE